ncbi:hypothetical protein GLOIN_2v823409 [Rhizophagus clarus]|uniref:Uncharacterized protein n=1 Tax=Rhizophagus clarus TaxID=94130 RepID=A0A8H3MA36_9GLOM|nr:hypothetical protein GLOIN_2v823409 [Rhizophagus clarus]
MISFAHAFYILLLPRSLFSLDERTNNNDPNNPWNIVTSYNLVFENGTVDTNPCIIQLPNGNTNMFIKFRTSLFAMYKFLTSDSGALSNWTYNDNAPLAIMIALFSLLIVKAEFPEVIYYYANTDETREKIQEMMDNKEWDNNEFTELKQDLLKKLNINIVLTNKNFIKKIERDI